MSEQPFAWVRKIDDALIQLDKMPTGGPSVSIDFQRISSQIASHFGVPALKIEKGECGWRTASQLREGLGAHTQPVGLLLSPLSGDVHWLMAKQDIAYLTSWLLNGQARARPISSEILQEGFYRYLILNALDALQHFEPFKQFTLKLEEEAAVQIESAFCIDVKLSYDSRSCWGRLIVSRELLTGWQRHFASLHLPFAATPLARSLEVPISLITGRFNLTRKEWKALKKGDFVALDRGSYDARRKEGLASLCLGATPLFHVGVKENKIKLLDFALFYEEDMQNHDTNEASAEELIPAEEGRSMAVKELPLYVTVELARLKMTVDKLLKLTPGHFLELPVHPDQGVVLSVGGQKVGRAELVYLGEVLGIRILETAD